MYEVESVYFHHISSRSPKFEKLIKNKSYMFFFSFVFPKITEVGAENVFKGL